MSDRRYADLADRALPWSARRGGAEPGPRHGAQGHLPQGEDPGGGRHGRRALRPRAREGRRRDRRADDTAGEARQHPAGAERRGPAGAPSQFGRGGRGQAAPVLRRVGAPGHDGLPDGHGHRGLGVPGQGALPAVAVADSGAAPGVCSRLLPGLPDAARPAGTGGIVDPHQGHPHLQGVRLWHGLPRLPHAAPRGPRVRARPEDCGREPAGRRLHVLAAPGLRGAGEGPSAVAPVAAWLRVWPHADLWSQHESGDRCGGDHLPRAGPAPRGRAPWAGALPRGAPEGHAHGPEELHGEHGPPVERQAESQHPRHRPGDHRRGA
mmetsp:Transcript_2553/g.8567  ORF Transcript_2553/g.8567 Transcript_2553/m.8567 type:complete len:322 (-) Transcript_2553:1629-2594(-)